MNQNNNYENTYENFGLEMDADRILWLAIDRKGASVNSLNREIFAELDDILNHITQLNPIGVVILSAKNKGFVAGADITQFTSLKNSDEAFNLIRQAQLVLNKIEALTIPTVAMINGFCLGGGLELALACRYRVAEESPSTLIGLPEVKLGIHPGWGGTVRLPRLIGAIEAMKMILPGDAYPAKKAEKVGIVDAAVPLRELKRAAKYYILNHPKSHSPGPSIIKILQFTNMKFSRFLLGKIFERNLSQRNVNKAHYPAPYAVIENWVKCGVAANGTGSASDHADDPMVNEAKSIAKLMMTDTSRNLVRVFFLQDRLKGLSKGGGFKAQHVHVIGAGVMGGDIAAWCAYKGLNVTLQDQSADKIAPAIKRAHQLFQKKLREPRLIQAAMDRLQADLEGSGVGKADVVIEAVFEDLATKQKLFKSLESKVKDTAILASNTSSIPLEKIAEALMDPSRLVGIHFFNPVAKMLLVEVVKGTNTSPEIVQRAINFVGQIGHLPLPVISHPGFLVNRILMPYLLEAMKLLDEGVSPYWIDKAAIDFGMPMGPVALADKVGLDVCLSIAEILVNYYGGTIPERLKQTVAKGWYGVKTGKGFYEYKNDKPILLKGSPPTQELSVICDRLILSMVKEAIDCLNEKVVEDGDLLDAGMIFGTGFAPFRGGPIQYVKTRGKNEVFSQLETFSKQFGDLFKTMKTGWWLEA